MSSPTPKLAEATYFELSYRPDVQGLPTVDFHAHAEVFEALARSAFGSELSFRERRFRRQYDGAVQIHSFRFDDNAYGHSKDEPVARLLPSELNPDWLSASVSFLEPKPKEDTPCQSPRLLPSTLTLGALCSWMQSDENPLHEEWAIDEPPFITRLQLLAGTLLDQNGAALISANLSREAGSVLADMDEGENLTVSESMRHFVRKVSTPRFKPVFWRGEPVDEPVRLDNSGHCHFYLHKTPSFSVDFESPGDGTRFGGRISTDGSGSELRGGNVDGQLEQSVYLVGLISLMAELKKTNS